jgi:hypothetical protein
MVRTKPCDNSIGVNATLALATPATQCERVDRVSRLASLDQRARAASSPSPQPAITCWRSSVTAPSGLGVTTLMGNWGMGKDT